MAGKELCMKHASEIKRLRKLGFCKRKIARILKIHRNTVSKYFEEDSSSNEASTLSETKQITIESTWVQEIDWEKVRSEYLSGVPLNIIHEELSESKKVSIQYPGFWKQAKKKISLSEATMVRIFKPAERSEIDYADGISILEPVTGEILTTEFFVGVLCHSRYTFAEFTWSQSSQDFLQSHVNMFNFFGGTPEVLSPDNLKSAVTKAHRYDPTINQAYARLAEYYDIAVVPARVKSPKDKAIVERTIQIFQRWFFMKVRNETFTSLLELNQCLKEHLLIFNKKHHRIFKRTREEMFLEERAHLKELPSSPYAVATHKRAVLSRDCHLVFCDNFYSAPYWLRGQELDVWATSTQVEIYSQGERVAVHARYKSTGKFLTDTSHYPPAQAAYAEEDIQKLVKQAEKVGTETLGLIEGLLQESHPLRHLRRIQGIVALSWKYSNELLEEACKEANRFNHPNVQYLERVIKTRKGVKRKTETTGIVNRAYNPHLRGTNNIH